MGVLFHVGAKAVLGHIQYNLSYSAQKKVRVLEKRKLFGRMDENMK